MNLSSKLWLVYNTDYKKVVAFGDISNVIYETFQPKINKTNDNWEVKIKPYGYVEDTLHWKLEYTFEELTKDVVRVLYSRLLNGNYYTKLLIFQKK